MTEQRMTNAEAVLLCRRAKAACPQQQFDQYTPDMWHELLGDLRFEEADAALVEVVKSQPFVSPAEIREQVKRVRRKRIDEYGYILPPRELEHNPRAESAWIREMVQAVGDGRVLPGEEPETQELLGRVMPDWDKVLPSPERPTRSQLTTEKRRAKSPEHAAKLAEARAELPPPAPMPGLTDAREAAEVETEAVAES